MAHHDPTYPEIVAMHNWGVYDITTVAGDPVGYPDGPSSWEALARAGPVDATEEGGTYMLAPNPQDGETLRQAVARQHGVGAYLHIPDVNSSDYIGIELHASPQFAFFSRIARHAGHILLHSLPSRAVPTDRVSISDETAPRLFVANFGVMTYEAFTKEYARWHPSAG